MQVELCGEVLVRDVGTQNLVQIVNLFIKFTVLPIFFRHRYATSECGWIQGGFLLAHTLNGN